MKLIALLLSALMIFETAVVFAQTQEEPSDQALGLVVPVLTEPVRVDADTEPPGDTVFTPPSDVLFKPDQDILLALLRRGYLNPFANNQFQPDLPILRAEFITLIYRAAKFRTPFVSEFAYFRDVPLNHWAYLPIEGFRMRNIVKGFSGGFFYPEIPLRRIEAAVMVSKSLGEDWLILSPQEVDATLAAYGESRESIEDWAEYDLARSLYVGFILPEYLQAPTIPGTVPSFNYTQTLNLEAPLRRLDAARLAYRRILIAEEDQPERSKRLLWIPQGVTMTVTPTSAISRAQFFVGQTLFFSLTEGVEVSGINVTLPRATRIHGRITEIDADHMGGTVTLDRALLPSGESYNLSATLTLAFKSDDDDTSFIVPGESFIFQTNAPQTP